jgi:hypothetical protein
LALAFTPAGATGMVVRLTNAELVSRSDLVVHGTVEAIQAIADGHVALVKVHAVLKGSMTASSTVRVAFSASVSESASFAVSERVLLFLRQTAPATYQTVGGAQGKFSIK